MKRKLIEVYQENLIQCDTNGCNYVIKNPSGDINEDTSKYINELCPECGYNLLTKEDYRLSQKLKNYINFMNKWFSWLTYILPKNKHKKSYYHVHNGINIWDEK